MKLYIITMVKLLVLYVFHEYNDRVNEFLTNSIFYDEDVDFLIICNDKSMNIDDKIVHSNISVFYRDNIGYDFGGWSDGLLTNDLYKNYTHFIFVNSSVIGPYLRPEYNGKWTDIYIENLNDDIKLFGSTINANHDYLSRHGDIKLSLAHVQSYIFSMDITTLYYLIEKGIFSNTEYVSSFNDAIWRKEVYMSQVIRENGWNIGSLLKMYHGVDFTFKDKTVLDYEQEFYDDLMWCTHQHMWDKYDLTFIKGNRYLY